MRPDLEPGSWPDAQSPSVALCGEIMRLAVKIRRRAETILARHHLTLSEFECLVALRLSPDGAAITPTELYERILISSGGLTKVMSHLQDRGLILRVPSPTDRRSRMLELTEEGAALVLRAMRAIREDHDSLMEQADLTEEEIAGFFRFRDKLMNVAG
ncbi:MarR family winged helix-turn-helix transcriptional regulator [Salipiger sp.]|uniref:MarR family winged helix-turn-helix transcriptional regulator n=1 Tax=Salipiger sp. TaxID=2078585 RepID=UPI003A981B1E